MSPSEFEREARLAMAVKLFAMGKLTSGQASQLAGLGRVEFLYELKRFNVSAIQVEGDELQQDLANAAKFVPALAPLQEGERRPLRHRGEAPLLTVRPGANNGLPGRDG
jgi:predicted HTH domain antitoxin